VPEGFEHHTRRRGLTEPWEPVYARRSTGGASAWQSEPALRMRTVVGSSLAG
jgi:hypothetical protein